jgi:hypothetical protein
MKDIIKTKIISKLMTHHLKQTEASKLEKKKVSVIPISIKKLVHVSLLFKNTILENKFQERQSHEKEIKIKTIMPGI